MTEVASNQLLSIIERVESVSDMMSVWDKVETWRRVVDYPTYEVSSWGRVRRGGRVLKTGLSHGYQIVSLSGGSNVRTSKVHRLVADAFLGRPPFDGALVAHNDGDQSNNRASNIRWASALENQADRIRHNSRVLGSQVFGAKLSEGDIPIIRERITSGEGYPSIAKAYGVSISTISLIKLKRTWTHA